MKKGELIELEASRFYHQKGIPVLVSDLMLRSMGLGQIDISILEKNTTSSWVLKIVEIKSSLYPGAIQLKRLRKTQDYLSRILELESKLEVKFCQKADHSLSF